MTIEAVIFTRLSGFAGLSALVSDRIYPVTLPQNVEMPAVTVALVSDIRIQAMGGFTGLVRARYQVTSWSGEHDDGTAGNPDEAVAVAKQLISALDGWTNTVGTVVQHSEVINKLQRHEADTQTYFVPVDVRISYEE